MWFNRVMPQPNKARSRIAHVADDQRLAGLRQTEKAATGSKPIPNQRLSASISGSESPLRTIRKPALWKWAGLLGSWLITAARGETAYLTPVADTSLIEIAPTNNFGGARFFNAGTTQVGTRNHGLLRFDLTTAVPRGSRIVAAELSLEVVGKPADGFAAEVFQLRRMRRAWGEGNKRSPDPEHPGFGSHAELSEATWLKPGLGEPNLWNEPGGLEGTDYAAESSSEQTIYGLPDSPYLFASTPRLVADVQGWLDRPEENFGWMLRPRDESIRFTARRFGAREDENQAPLLTLEFVPPPSFRGIEREGEETRLHCELSAGQGCVVEFCEDLGAGPNWTLLTQVPPPVQSGPVTVLDRINAGRRFYRFRLHP